MAFNWGGAAQGAVTGGLAGSSFGTPWGTAIGAGLGGLEGLFQSNPADEAKKYLNQIPDTLKTYFEPYFNAGTGALGNLQNAYGEQMNDPNAIISRLGSGYKASPGYQWRLGQGEQAIGNAAAANGLAGTSSHQQGAGQLAENLANQDYQNYLNSALGLYGTGIQGQQQLANMGQQAGQNLGLGLGGNLQTQAGLGYAGQASQNQNTSDFLSSILSYLKNPNSNLNNPNSNLKNPNSQRSY